MAYRKAATAEAEERILTGRIIGYPKGQVPSGPIHQYNCFPAGAPAFAGNLERRGDSVYLISTGVPTMVDSVITATAPCTAMLQETPVVTMDHFHGMS
jgi:hypothetical protein